jgi:chemotaxis protein MotB
MADECKKKKAQAGGAPAWMATYADMVTLLLCFFVLLLTMADVNQKKFKQVTATLRMAFGVQQRDPFHEIPTFNSVVKTEYGAQNNTLVPLDHPKMILDMRTLEQQQEDNEKKERFEKNLQVITEALKEETEQQLIEIDTEDDSIIVRVREDVSFPSGSDQLTSNFHKISEKIAKTLAKTEGALEISGHTDNIPIRTHRFRNNWDLSSARAASMAIALMHEAKIAEHRFTILGHADTRPRADNRTPEGRAKNRRVEIAIRPDVNGRVPAAIVPEDQVVEPRVLDIDKILGH